MGQGSLDHVSSNMAAGSQHHQQQGSILHSHHQSHYSVSSASTGAHATGIPTWDSRSNAAGSGDVGSVSKSKGVRHNKHSRSVAVQTEATLLPYPLGSTWLEGASKSSAAGAHLVMAGAEGGSSASFRQSHDDGSSAVGGGASSVADDTRSLEMRSMPSLWGSYDAAHRGGISSGGGAVIDAGASYLAGGSVSLDDGSSTSYTIKSANYALTQPHGNAAPSSKHRALSKLRHGNSSSGHHPLPSQFRDVEQILSDVAAGGGISNGRSHAVKVVLPKYAGMGNIGGSEFREPGQSYSPYASKGGASDDHSMHSRSRRSHNNSNKLQQGSLSQQQQQQQQPSPLMAVSGQGFVSPFVLPRLT